MANLTPVVSRGRLSLTQIITMADTSPINGAKLANGQLVNKARALYLSDRWAGTMEELAREVGCSVGTIYNASKRECWVEWRQQVTSATENPIVRASGQSLLKDWANAAKVNAEAIDELGKLKAGLVEIADQTDAQAIMKRACILDTIKGLRAIAITAKDSFLAMQICLLRRVGPEELKRLTGGAGELEKAATGREVDGGPDFEGDSGY